MHVDDDGTRRVERELDRIFASLGHGMYVVDTERRILLWNRAAESILGWSEEEALGRSCREFIGHTDDNGRQLCDEDCPLVASMGESHSIFAGTVWGQSRDGVKIPVNVSCAPLFDGDGKLVGAVEVFSDMTHEKELESFKNSMVSVVAHELRTPLTSMKGYLELVIDGEVGGVTGQQREFLGIVESNVVRLEELVNDLLDLGRLESGRVVVHWEPMDLETMLGETLDTLRPMAVERGLRLDFEVSETPPVQGDRQLFARVLSNLVSNAVKYTVEGGITIRLGRDGDRASIEVEDTGVGIPEDELGLVLEKFFRASTAAGTGSTGSGLGLSITGEIVEKHDGELRLQSTVGKGSRFTVLLPSAKDATIL
ncbi:MAG: PAS domain-containing sensor histidine kinase [Actinobacteria bacterium]|nr:PAS domain-containing sensor histidine kinase [Actinomycetota bacterium]MBU1943768.1 PAS domain-containing sensor histidine kinase [Actinomycetota bacterium]MBU2688792.1 PAS domain-containing sensor histidine kinase [Actinomycetota bacterium]